MPPEEASFQSFFIARVKDRGISLKKLAEETGIAPRHLANMAHGRFDDLPPMPYVRGYLVRLGNVLDFDGEAWWEKIKKDGFIKNSGSTDDLPRNRFVRVSHAKFVWAGVAATALIVYLAFQLPVVFGRPRIAITFPKPNPYATTSSTLVIRGIVRSANSLSLNGDPVAISPDGSWEKSVLLQNGPNSFTVTAKKFLGGEVSVSEEILYTAPPGSAATSTASSTTALTTAPAVHFFKPSEIPATGSFYQ